MSKIIPVLSILLLVSFATAQDSEILKILIDSSDMVIEGTIATKQCIGSSIGVEECTYKIDVNSIYKGNPILHSPDFIAGYRNDEKHAKALKVIYIKRECFSGENCLGRNQNIILFLKKIANRDLKTEEYELADRLFGMQSFNWNLAKETRRMSLMSAE